MSKFPKSLLIGLIGWLLFHCSDSRYLLNHEEIKSAYNDFEVAFIPELKRVVLEENRDLKGSAIYFLGLYYRDYLQEDDLSSEEAQAQTEIKEFLEDYYSKTSDFNLKNLILMALSYHPTPDHEVIAFIIDELEKTEQKEIKLYLLKLIRKESHLGHLAPNEKIKNLVEQNISDEDPQIFEQSLITYLSILSSSQEKIEKLKILLANSSNIYRQFILNYHLKKLNHSVSS